MTSSSAMATRRYTVLIEKGPRSYGATVPDLPGCVAVAKSRREVILLITEAIPLHIRAMDADGQVAPEPVHEAVVVDVSPAPVSEIVARLEGGDLRAFTDALPRIDHRVATGFKVKGRP